MLMMGLIGLTPAYAGKTMSRARLGERRWAHPRVCGEDDGFTLTAEHDEGSPPRMRGRRRHLLDVDDIDRLTPAYAGKTTTWNSARADSRAHPRACGEDVPLSTGNARSLGSPPRMRGRQDR